MVLGKKLLALILVGALTAAVGVPLFGYLTAPSEAELAAAQLERAKAKAKATLPSCPEEAASRFAEFMSTRSMAEAQTLLEEQCELAVDTAVQLSFLALARGNREDFVYYAEQSALPTESGQEFLRAILAFSAASSYADEALSAEPINIEKAQQSIDLSIRATELFPDYAPPYLLEIAMLGHIGEYDKAALKAQEAATTLDDLSYFDLSKEIEAWKAGGDIPARLQREVLLNPEPAEDTLSQ